MPNTAPKLRVPPRLMFGRTEWREVTGLPTKCCDELVASGQIKSFKVGRRRMFLVAEVEEWLRGLSNSGAKIKPSAPRKAQS